MHGRAAKIAARLIICGVPDKSAATLIRCSDLQLKHRRLHLRRLDQADTEEDDRVLICILARSLFCTKAIKLIVDPFYPTIANKALIPDVSHWDVKARSIILVDTTNIEGAILV